MLCPNVLTDCRACARKEQRERAIDGNGRQFALTAAGPADERVANSFCSQPADVWSLIRKQAQRLLNV
jgi:hypothetical protein